MQITNPIHQPCPDLPCHSLNAQQKQHGLEMLKKVRAEVGRECLNKLREESKGASRAKQAELNQKAKHISQVWC